ncbi:hypothetical protein K8352_14105 [Flavobacteriaceae bacterium F89]|uniref:Uncharacterized protein n=1 Tax=Cerina litoralis TaxID=2874477 RepID=A0AAE3EXE0_9FLAO|nr:hypothetical protein [Cerina litoralis]MCG2461889.1 hypothetical protein [Cerina litoralis]
MQVNKKLLWVLLILILSVSTTMAQYGYGRGYNGYGYGRQRSGIPQTDQTPEKKDPPTAKEIVDSQMPAITETIGLNEFEQAVMSSILTKYIQQRIELQILQLDQDKTRAALDDIVTNEDAELKAGLPEDKYNAFKELQKEGLQKAKKKKKKARKKKKKD